MLLRQYFSLVHISGRKSVYHSCKMMYKNIIVDDSTIIYTYACQPLIIIFVLLPMTLRRLYIVICVTVHEQTLHLMNHTLYVYIIIRVFFIVSTINFIYMCTIGLPYKKKNQDASLLENNKKYLHSILFSPTFLLCFEKSEL